MIFKCGVGWPERPMDNDERRAAWAIKYFQLHRVHLPDPKLEKVNEQRKCKDSEASPSWTATT